jgi:hypothetical protein
MKAARKIKENKKLESKLDYSQVWYLAIFMFTFIINFLQE